MKIAEDTGGFIGHAIAVAIFEAPDFIAFNGEVFPVVGTVAVEVFEPFVFFAALGSEGFVQKGPPVFNALQADRLGHPVAVPPDIKFRVFLAIGPREVHAPEVVNVHGHRVGCQGVGGPKAELNPICEFDSGFILQLQCLLLGFCCGFLYTDGIRQFHAGDDQQGEYAQKGDFFSKCFSECHSQIV